VSITLIFNQNRICWCICSERSQMWNFVKIRPFRVSFYANGRTDMTGLTTNLCNCFLEVSETYYHEILKTYPIWKEITPCFPLFCNKHSYFELGIYITNKVPVLITWSSDIYFILFNIILSKIKTKCLKVLSQHPTVHDMHWLYLISLNSHPKMV
jgi:hypothetical protein